MINEPLVVPRLIEGGWTNLVILTYGASLEFFETRLLRQLARVPQQVLLVDARRLADTFGEAARTGRRLNHANRTYIAAGVRSARAFHPKAVMLTNEAEGRLLVGSGNLGQDGYATAGELWHIFSYRLDYCDHLPRFAAVRSLIDGIGALGWLDRPAVDMLAEVWSSTPWLSAATAPAGPRHVIDNLDRRLLDAIAAAVTWPVEVLTIYAPFFDEDAAALCALLDTLRPARLQLLLTRDTSINLAAVHAALATRATQVEYIELAVAGAAETYVHAKLIHAVGSTHELTVTGSPNLSRSALLLPAAAGNVELAVIETRPRDGFTDLYESLDLRPLSDPDELDISYRPGVPAVTKFSDALPLLLWSEIYGDQLTLIFDRPVDPDDVMVADRAAIPVSAKSVTVDGSRLLLRLDPSALEQVRGGHITVTIGVGDPIPSWPYHLSELFSRRQRATDSSTLDRFAELPGTDAEVMELLDRLDQALVMDPVAVWRLTAANQVEEPVSDDEALSISWHDLDWSSLRAHPVYRSYQPGSTSGDLTDIQRVIRSIATRLSEHGTDPARASTSSSEGPDSKHQPARRLSLATRTRMAIRRLVVRYLRAMHDPEFQRQLGAAVSVRNAAIFNHLVSRLLDLDLIDPGIGIQAHLATWAWVWGSATEEGLLRSLAPDERELVKHVLDETRMRHTTVRALCSLDQYDFDTELGAAVRDATHYLLVDEIFNLDSTLLREAAYDYRPVRRMVNALRTVAASVNVIEAVLAPWQLPWTAGRWEEQEVAKPDGTKARVRVLLITEPISQLTPHSARRGLGRLAAYSQIARGEYSYLRIRFATGLDMCYWDAATKSGVCYIGREETDFNSLPIETPSWYKRLQILGSRD